MSIFDSLPELITVPELAKCLRIGKNKAYELITSGVIPSIKIGRQLRVLKRDIISYLTVSRLKNM